MSGFKYMCYSVVCAWCRRTLELVGADEERMDGEVSHGICESCQEEVFGVCDQ